MTNPSRLSNPVLLLAAATAGFAAWVAYDAAHWGAPAAADPEDAPEFAAAAAADSQLPPEVRRSRGFHRLHPGMSRPLVERLLRGVPPVEESSEVSGGDPVFRARYRVYLPRPLATALPGPFVPGPHLITLTFNAACPDQTLLELTADPV
jgi:hypothetical protein